MAKQATRNPLSVRRSRQRAKTIETASVALAQAGLEHRIAMVEISAEARQIAQLLREELVHKLPIGSLFLALETVAAEQARLILRKK